jgi:glycosyltransferase involved in cell wall biosynthesis
VISFIVIGRNEGWKITNCLSGVMRTIEYNEMKNYEIIYIDSGSTDDSIQRVSEFPEVKRLLIIGDFNAAIARNIGAREAHGDILFFIDGDVEIFPQFLKRVTDGASHLIYDCVTGQLNNFYYNQAGNLLGRGPATYKGTTPKDEKVVKASGGNFLIKRSIWILTGEMKTKFKKNEDLDFILRLSRKGIKTIRVPEFIGVHHTIDHRNNERMWKTVTSGSVMYPGVLLRDHILNLDKIKHTLRRQYTSLLLLLSAIILPFNVIISGTICLLFLLVTGLKSFVNARHVKLRNKNRAVYLIERFAYQIVHDFVFWGGFFFFYPSEKKIKYKQIT